MTNNIEKLYELANTCLKWNWDTSKFEYPSFPAEKQLELIKWIALNVGNITTFSCPKNEFFLTCIFKGGNSKDFSQALAGLVCELWEDLDDTEKMEVERILE